MGWRRRGLSNADKRVLYIWMSEYFVTKNSDVLKFIGVSERATMQRGWVSANNGRRVVNFFNFVWTILWTSLYSYHSDLQWCWSYIFAVQFKLFNFWESAFKWQVLYTKCEKLIKRNNLIESSRSLVIISKERYRFQRIYLSPVC